MQTINTCINETDKNLNTQHMFHILSGGKVLLEMVNISAFHSWNIFLMSLTSQWLQTSKQSLLITINRLTRRVTVYQETHCNIGSKIAFPTSVL